MADATPPQLLRHELKGMTADQIEAARVAGRLRDALSGNETKHCETCTCNTKENQ